MTIKKQDQEPANAPGDAAQSEDAAERITRSVLDHVESLAESCQATAIFVYADALRGGLPVSEAWQQRTFYVAGTEERRRADEQQGRQTVHVPDVPFTRVGQVKVALFLALANRQIQVGDTVVCLSGLAGTGSLDTVLIMQARHELETWSMGTHEDAAVAAGVRAGVLERVLDLASQLGYEGREGRPIGALFVVGDYDRVLPMTRPLILNPFAGHPEEARNILNPALDETIKELSSIDGAFVVRGDGVIESCGTYINAPMRQDTAIFPGLGARHQAAAAITAASDAIAVTVSQSTGSILVFRKGRVITEIEKPRSSAAREVGPSS